MTEGILILYLTLAVPRVGQWSISTPGHPKIAGMAPKAPVPYLTCPACSSPTRPLGQVTGDQFTSNVWLRRVWQLQSQRLVAWVLRQMPLAAGSVLAKRRVSPLFCYVFLDARTFAECPYHTSAQHRPQSIIRVICFPAALSDVNWGAMAGHWSTRGPV